MRVTQGGNFANCAIFFGINNVAEQDESLELYDIR